MWRARRARRELARIAALWAHRHEYSEGEQRGIALALEDWWIQDCMEVLEMVENWACGCDDDMMIPSGTHRGGCPVLNKTASVVRGGESIPRTEYERLFRAHMERLTTLTMSKNANYANDVDALANFRFIERLTGGKVTTVDGLLTRMSDKFMRIANLLSGAENRHEAVVDNLDDLAVYAVILRIYLESKEVASGRQT